MPNPLHPTCPLEDGVLADRLGLTTREFQRYRSQGLVTVSITEAEGERTVKVSCQIGNRIWEGLVQCGRIVFEEVRFLRGVRSRSSAR